MRNQTEVYDLCRYFVETIPQTFKDSVLGHIRARDLKSLCSVSQLYRQHCISAYDFQVLLQIEAFFKKNELFSDDATCAVAAASSFQKAEEHCRVVNLRLDEFYSEQTDFTLLVEKAQAWISHVLGEFAVFQESIPDMVKVTNGATSTTPRRNSRMFMKIKREYRCPAPAVPYLRTLATYFGLPAPRVRVSGINRVVFVPKNWKTHRTIACEPDGALPFQLAFDAYAKTRLRRFGIDLADQSRNQGLALRGSLDGSQATIDLEQASDTVSLRAVELLFPAQWYQYLLAFRSSHYKGVPDTPSAILGTGKYEKFSSMGNGSTFAIETLIFAACCHAVGSRDYSVYGDDICITTPHAEPLIELLAYLGFTTNKEKTFLSGPYRESCGSHYYSGTYITPHYVRGNVKLKNHISHNVNGLAPLALESPKLAAALRNICREEDLLVVPYTSDTTAGVHTSAYVCFERKVLRFVKPKYGYWPCLPSYRAYTIKTSTRNCFDCRAWVLWHMASRKRRVEIMPGVDEPLVRSRYADGTLKYKRAIVYYSGRHEEPDHLPWWSNYLFADS